MKIRAEVTGLLHITEIDEENESPDVDAMFKVGDTIEANIAAIREDDHELALTLLKTPRNKLGDKSESKSE